MTDGYLSYETGPIRPPSEAGSLLVRFTRNCSHNRCAFCHTYRDTKFSLRKPEEIRADLESIRKLADFIIATSQRIGEGGEINRRVIGDVVNNPAFPPQGHQVAVWLYNGGKNVFIQDANSPIMRTPDFVEALTGLKELFPTVERVTTYARSKTLARKSADEMNQWRSAGLTRVHVGLETGHDPLLELINKGETSQDHITGGLKVIEAGLELSEYVILGLGGKRLWREHARDTAKVLNEINPHFIRVRTLAIVPGTGMDDLRNRGDFEKADDELVAEEEKLLLQSLEVNRSYFASDHILNLFEEIEGQLPGDKGSMIAVIDRFKQLPERDRKIFILARRAGAIRSLDDLTDSFQYERFSKVLGEIESQGLTVDEAIEQMMRRYI